MRVLLSGAAKEYEIVGLFGYGDTTDLGAVTVAAFDLATAQREFDAGGSIDAVYVQRDADVSTAELQARIETALGPGYEVLTAAEATVEVGQPVRQFLGFFTDALLGFAAIGVVVGAFIIFNTFTILVAQRTRELGLLRAMGATGGQVVRSVVLEALVVGAVASVDRARGWGSCSGSGSSTCCARSGSTSRRPPRSCSPAPSSSRCSSASWSPWSRPPSPRCAAARVPPVAAIADVPERAVGAFGRRIAIGLVVLVAGGALLAYGLARARDVSGILDQVQVVAFGAFGVLLGVVLLLPAVVRPAVRALGAPLRRFGPPGVAGARQRDAQPAAHRDHGVGAGDRSRARRPHRDVRRVGAGVGRGEHGRRAAGRLRREVRRLRRLLDRRRSTGLRALPEVTTAASMRFADGAVDGDVKTVGSIDPDVLTKVVDLEVLRGDAAALDGSGVLVSDELARHAGVDVGDQLPVQFARGQVPLDRARRSTGSRTSSGSSVRRCRCSWRRRRSASGPEARRRTRSCWCRPKAVRPSPTNAPCSTRSHEDFPNIDVLTRAEFRDDQQAQVDQFLTVLIAILALSEIIAILGIINTLALSVYERTRELGLLRVVGMSRRQVRRMIRWESVVIAVLGGIVGLALGMLWGWAFARALEEQGITVFRIPWLEVLLFVGGSMLAGVLAAVFPAWRASRLDVLDAIATE